MRHDEAYLLAQNAQALVDHLKSSKMTEIEILAIQAVAYKAWALFEALKQDIQEQEDRNANMPDCPSCGSSQTSVPHPLDKTFKSACIICGYCFGKKA